MANIGYAFQPGLGSLPMGGPSSRGGSEQLPSAVQIKSLQLPQRTSPNQLAPLALLNAPGGAGLGVLGPQLLQLLMRAFAPQGQQPGMPALGPSAAGPTLGPAPSAPAQPGAPASPGMSSVPSVTGARGPYSPFIPQERQLGGPTQPNVPQVSPGALLPRIIAAQSGGGAAPGVNQDEWGRVGGSLDSLPGYTPPAQPYAPQMPQMNLSQIAPWLFGPGTNLFGG